MKNTLVLLACVAFNLVALSQSPEVVSSPITKQNYESNAVVWSQPIGSEIGVVNTYFNSESNGFFVSDDFRLTESYTLETITVFGFNVDMNFLDDLTGFDLYIYENDESANIPISDPSQPGTGLLELIDLDPLTGGISIEHPTATDNYHVTVDITAANGGSEFILPAGDYWLVAYPRMDVPVQNSVLWGWYDGNVPNAGINQGQLIDKANLFNVGATSWTPMLDVVSIGSLAFLIEGFTDLNTEDYQKLSDLITVFPNPTSESIHLKIDSTLEIEFIAIYSIIGKDMEIELINGEINVAAFPSGIYSLKIETNKGSIRRKIIRR